MNHVPRLRIRSVDAFKSTSFLHRGYVVGCTVHCSLREDFSKARWSGSHKAGLGGNQRSPTCVLGNLRVESADSRFHSRWGDLTKNQRPKTKDHGTLITGRSLCNPEL